MQLLLDSIERLAKLFEKYFFLLAQPCDFCRSSLRLKDLSRPLEVVDNFVYLCGDILVDSRSEFKLGNDLGRRLGTLSGMPNLMNQFLKILDQLGPSFKFVFNDVLDVDVAV